ncbi:hypothetical protein O181_036078 [Austropuccinia psidii MF-1]|uniref:Integrase catalytic domain-containing protein n=1 Tax=Austropuccinia psidii MF-1 TaxID=1389203 RepID=A0A9Q3D8S3_9BASI|nr:hypothetical protein [Austropuccinia psidii MF-1]
MIQIQEPKFQLKIAHMDWVKALPEGGDRSFNACLVLVDRYSKPQMLLPFHKDDTAMDTSITTWNRVISHTGLFHNIIIDRDPKFTSALWKTLHNGLAEKIIQTLEGMIRRFCAYGLGLKGSDCFTHDWCTLTPALELAYKESIHSSSGKTPEMLEQS